MLHAILKNSSSAQHTSLPQWKIKSDSGMDINPRGQDVVSIFSSFSLNNLYLFPTYTAWGIYPLSACLVPKPLPETASTP